MATTTSESVNVSWRAATAWGLVMSWMNAASPSLSDFQMTAATGMRTMSPSQAAAIPGPRIPRDMPREPAPCRLP